MDTPKNTKEPTKAQNKPFKALTKEKGKLNQPCSFTALTTQTKLIRKLLK